MKTPTQEQFQTVIDNLEKANTAKALVNMGETEVNYCGSPMCHGGWYAFSKDLRDIDEFSDNDSYISYFIGAEEMGKDLGFKDQFELMQWASSNDEIWGNKSGSYMFNGETAFLDGMTPITSLSQIIDHWKGVKERALQYA